eukprot:SAG11_NODE_296_length_11092_cov_24.402620_8_plen_81_part_00
MRAFSCMEPRATIPMKLSVAYGARRVRKRSASRRLGSRVATRKMSLKLTMTLPPTVNGGHDYKDYIRVPRILDLASSIDP